MLSKQASFELHIFGSVFIYATAADSVFQNVANCIGILKACGDVMMKRVDDSSELCSIHCNKQKKLNIVRSRCVCLSLRPTPRLSLAL